MGDSRRPASYDPRMSTEANERLHSAADFGRWRDFWWNPDHLALIASRLELGRVRSVLDVGSGIGHWGLLLLGSVLATETSLVGVEREPAWVAEATRRADAAGLADRVRYEHGVAEALPFKDSSFDLVTCQTLMIHVADPHVVLGEMIRVAKPGGLILLAEPNNRASMLVDTAPNASVEEVLDRLEFYLVCERGKMALGEGNFSVGDLLPMYLAQQGAVGIETFMADRTFSLTPPYDSDAQEALRTEVLAKAELGRWVWSYEEAKRFFLAGAGAEADFDARWERRIVEDRAVAATIRSGSYYSAGGTVCYVVAARRSG